MPTKPEQADQTVDLLKDILITQLAVAGVQQHRIRAIIGCDINRVSRIAKHLKAAKKTGEMTNGAKEKRK